MSKKGNRERAEMIRSMSGISAAIAKRKRPSLYRRVTSRVHVPALVCTSVIVIGAILAHAFV